MVQSVGIDYTVLTVWPGTQRGSAQPRVLGNVATVLGSYPRTNMSTVPSASTSHSNFVSIFNAALETYKRKTKQDLTSHPLLPTLHSCDSPEAILTTLREQIPAFSRTQNGDDGLTKWVAPTVNVLYSFSATLGGGVGLVNFGTVSS